jgi:UPF0716 family protein affecting phage T7 exclusion
MSDIDAVWSDAKKGFNNTLAIWQSLRYALQVLSRPIALTTQVFLRHSYGERYFTVLHAFWALILIVGVTAMEVGLRKAIQVAVLDPYGRVQQPSDATLAGAMMIGVVWVIAFVIATAGHLVAISDRHKDRKRWHSMSMGEPLAAWLTNGMQYAIAGTLGLFMMLLGFYFVGLLLIGSAIRSAWEDMGAATEFYYRILDAIDGEIEAENLSKAVEMRVSGSATKGLAVRLPTGVLETFRNPSQRSGQPGSAGMDRLSQASSEVESKSQETTNVGATTQSGTAVAAEERR